MAIYERERHPLNRYTTAEYLLLLFPELKKEEADDLITRLLEAGELEPENESERRDDVGEAWTVSWESWIRFENRTHHKQKKEQEEQVKEIKTLLEELLIKMDDLTKAVKDL